VGAVAPGIGYEKIRSLNMWPRITVTTASTSFYGEPGVRPDNIYSFWLAQEWVNGERSFV
jgi:hypothetical protein